MMFKNAVLGLLMLLSTQAYARVDYTDHAVSNWADAYFTQAMAERRMSGAVVSVVQDGKIVFSKGYGYADYDKKIAVDPTVTQFRIGSTSKTFTATAIAQLMDRGLIKSLDDPANLYLKRDQLPSVDGRDITLRDLITHRAGFANRTFHIATDHEMALPLSPKIVQSHRPDIVRPVADRAVYSNYSTTLLGMIVEDITGMTIGDYFDKYIFMPLGMSHSTLNMTPRPTTQLAQSYAFLPDGSTQAIPHWGVNPFFAAAGAINSTAADMAQYMIAHLNGGRDGASPLNIRPATFDLMHSRLAGNHPAVQGFGMIFMTMEWAGKTGFGHGGDWPGFHSIMWMMPDDNAGVFMSIMAESPDVPLYDTLTGADYLKPQAGSPVMAPLTNIGALMGFLKHFYGDDTPAVAPGRLKIEDLVGDYRHEYRAYGTVEFFLDFLNGPFAVISVRKADDDMITINGQGPYQQVAPGVFWNGKMESGIDGTFTNSALWAFKWDENDNRYYATPRLSIDPFVKVAFWENPNNYTVLLLISAPILFTALVAAFWRQAEGRLGRVIKWVVFALPVTFALVPVSLFFGYGENSSFLWHFMLGRSSHFIVAIVFANLFLLLALATAFHTVQSWRRLSGGMGIWQTLKCLHTSLISLGAIAAVLFLWFYNFIGVNLP